MAQTVEHLPSKRETLSSNPGTQVGETDTQKVPNPEEISALLGVARSH
jgi:hypothetical protein